MALTLNETLSPEKQTASEEAVTPDLLTQPSALPMVDGKTLRFASPASEPTQTPRLRRKANLYADPAGKWFDYALLTLLLVCAASGAVLLISSVLR